jgi:hypothetical protein
LALGVKAVLISSNFLLEEEWGFGGAGGSKIEGCQVEGSDELTFNEELGRGDSRTK